MTNQIPDGEKTKRIIEVPEGKNLWRVIDRTGDTKHLWDPKNEEDIKEMKAIFKRLVRYGRHKAFYITKDNKAGNEMKEFDETAGMVLIMPPVAGG